MHDETAPGMTVPFETLNPAVLSYIKELEARYTQQLREIKNEYIILKEKYDLLIYKRFVRSAERLLADGKQPLLFNAEEIKTVTVPENTGGGFEEVKSHARRKAGRKAIDPKIPREEKIIDLEESEKTCACGSNLTRIGEETNEKLHIEPPRIYAVKTIRPKYACRHCEGTADEEKKTVRVAPAEPSVIPKSIVSPSLLSTVIVQKYEDHLPFYRQEKQFARIMVTISRQDMSNWQRLAYNKIEPLFGLMEETLKSGPVIQMDETTALVMGEEGRDDTQKSYVWVALGGPPGKKTAVYKYRRTRCGEHAKKLLEGYGGYLQTDGYAGYDSALKGNGKIIHAGCFAHARRNFFEAAQVNTNTGTAKKGVEFIKTLYVIESKLRKKYGGEEDLKKFCRVRRLCVSRPLKDFKEWLVNTKDCVPPSTLLGKAVCYSLSQWDKLVRYIESPYLTPDNNACENAVRPFVLGRKSWMFNKSPEGAESSCGMYSLIQTAKLNGLNPFDYLKTLFEKAPYASSREDWEKLLPWNIFKI